MSKKSFTAAPRPNQQPSPEDIAAYEQGGAGHDSDTPTTPPEKDTAKTGAGSNAVEDEPTKRLSLDLPASVHKRFKTACSATDRKMTDEVVRYIQKRTEQLEKQSGMFQSA